VRADLHQHLLGEPLLEALAERAVAPLTRRQGSAWWLEVPGEAPHRVNLEAEDAARRAAQLEADGLDHAVVGLSGVLGIEGLPTEEAGRLLTAHDEGLAALPGRFWRWAAVSLLEPSADAVEAQVAGGAVGLTLPAGALATPAGLERLAPLLEPLARRGRPLFVHPGPSPWEPAPTGGTGGWWTALTRYVAEMNAAWHSFVATGPGSVPPVPVVFALLGGLAPLHLERLAVRGGPAERALDPRFHYEVSSYGPRAIEAVGRVVGADRLVYGSDRPMVSPPPPADSPWTHLAARNAADLLTAS